MLIRYLFRKPRFPLICDVQGLLIGAETAAELAKRVGRAKMPPGENLPIVDATGEGRAFHTGYRAISPLTFKKNWTKKEIIAMFNDSHTARQSGIEYPAKALSSKRLDPIIREIALLIKRANNEIRLGGAKSGSR